MSEQPHGPTTHHQPEKAGNPKTKGMFAGNGKWYIIGGLGLVAVLVFIFVRQSNSNTSTTSSTPSTTLDPTTEAMLQSALSAVSNGQGNSGYGNYGSGYGGYPWSSGNMGSGSSGTGSSTGMNNAGTNPATINVPDGSGGWMAVSFPGVSQEQQFYQNEGATVSSTGGQNWPGGLTYQQIISGVQSVGGSQAGPTGQSGYGTYTYGPGGSGTTRVNATLPNGSQVW